MSAVLREELEGAFDVRCYDRRRVCHNSPDCSKRPPLGLPLAPKRGLVLVTPIQFPEHPSHNRPRDVAIPPSADMSVDQVPTLGPTLVTLAGLEGPSRGFSAGASAYRVRRGERADRVSCGPLQPALGSLL